MSPEQERALGLLMARTQRADAAACDLLLKELQVVVRRFARRRVGDVPWLEDVVQETLIAVHRGRHSWNPARPFVPWLYAVAQSRLIDVIRRERRVAAREVSHENALAAAYKHSVEASVQAASEIRTAMASLTPPQRRVVELLKLEERSIQDVAAALGLSEGNVRVIAHRAMTRLRRVVGRP
ncbi:MAG: sigma-70 family RNA polymerase sigma factor [Acidobacteria bacterium]|nr:sigma-70 family RNA polymerase sigma factor [Acidobacteriota bacterium]